MKKYLFMLAVAMCGLLFTGCDGYKNDNALIEETSWYHRNQWGETDISLYFAKIYCFYTEYDTKVKTQNKFTLKGKDITLENVDTKEVLHAEYYGDSIIFKGTTFKRRID